MRSPLVDNDNRGTTGKLTGVCASAELGARFNQVIDSELNPLLMPGTLKPHALSSIQLRARESWQPHLEEACISQDTSDLLQIKSLLLDKLTTGATSNAAASLGTPIPSSPRQSTNDEDDI